VDTIVRGVMQVVARRLLDDSTAAVAMVSGSGRRHLVVRGPRLTDEAATGRYRIADVVGPGSGTTVARADLATAILDLVERDPWPTGWPVVSAG
jgi:hypothetical protein